MASYDDNPFAAAGSAFRKQRAYEEASVRKEVNDNYKSKPVVYEPAVVIQPKKVEQKNAFDAAAEAPVPPVMSSSTTTSNTATPAPAPVSPPQDPSAWLSQDPVSSGVAGLKLGEKETSKPQWVSDKECPNCTGNIYKKINHISSLMNQSLFSFLSFYQDTR
jgi:hypothetical protein